MVIFVANADVVDDATTSAAMHNGIRMNFPRVSRRTARRRGFVAPPLRPLQWDWRLCAPRRRCDRDRRCPRVSSSISRLAIPPSAADLLDLYADAGVDVVECGWPARDPYLDGPDVRASMARALAA